MKDGEISGLHKEDNIVFCFQFSSQELKSMDILIYIYKSFTKIWFKKKDNTLIRLYTYMHLNIKKMIEILASLPGFFSALAKNALKTNTVSTSMNW